MQGHTHTLTDISCKYMNLMISIPEIASLKVNVLDESLASVSSLKSERGREREIGEVEIRGG